MFKTGEALLYTVSQFAELTGLSPRTIWRRIAGGDLPHLRIGRRVLIPADAARQWVRRNTING